MLKFFGCITNLLTESAMFGFQSWTPKGPNIADSVNRFVIIKMFNLDQALYSRFEFSCVSNYLVVLS